MIKIKIKNNISETTNDLVLEISRKIKIKPSFLILELIPRGHILYKVKTKYNDIGIISKVFDNLIFIEKYDKKH